MVIANDNWIVPIFSPKALCMAWHSLLNLEESSVTLMESNQAISSMGTQGVEAF